MNLIDQKLADALPDCDVSSDPLRKRAFHAAGKRFLRRVAQELGLAKDSCHLYSQQKCCAVCGEIVLKTDAVYLELRQGLIGWERTYLLYRVGDDGKNRFIDLKRLHDEHRASQFIESLKMLGGPALQGINSTYQLAA
jgi:hypothetical protein